MLIILFNFIYLLQLKESRSLELSSQCSNHGFFYFNKCFCLPQWKGQICQQENTNSWNNTEDTCDDLISRLDYLANISPFNYNGDDNEFSRLNGDVIQMIQYQDTSNQWIKMHDLSENFKIFGDSILPQDLLQGDLGNCYFIAALASLVNIRKGYLIKQAFMTKEDNQNHVYVTRWLIDGKPRYVAVDDWIPGDKLPHFAKTFGDYDYWGIILEKAWAKIHGSYKNSEGGWAPIVWQALTQAHTYYKNHKDTNYMEMKKLLIDLFSKQYPISATTTQGEKQYLQEKHAYSILNLYKIKMEDKNRKILILIYNPRQKEVWKDNPWVESSINWNENIKSQVKDYIDNENDGFFYLNPLSYHQVFGRTYWAEIQENYFTFFQDSQIIAENQNSMIDFNYTGESKSIYIKIPVSNIKLHMNCPSPFIVKSLQVKDPSGQTFENNQGIKIENAQKGTYQIQAIIQQIKNWHKYFTYTIYAPLGSIQFENSNENNKNDNENMNKNRILKDDKNETQKFDLQCENNSNKNSICNKILGKCECKKGFYGENCQKYNNLQNFCLKFSKKYLCNNRGNWNKIIQKLCLKKCKTDKNK